MVDLDPANIEKFIGTVERLSSVVEKSDQNFSNFIKKIENLPNNPLGKATESAEKFNKTVQEFNFSSINKAINSLSVFDLSLKSISDIGNKFLNNLSDSFDSLEQKSKSNTSALNGTSAALSFLSTKIVGTTDVVKQFNIESKKSGFASNITSDITAVTKFAEAMGSIVLPESLSKAVKILNQIGTEAASAAENLIQAENAFMNIKAAQGQAGSLNEGLVSLDNISREYSKYNEIIYQVAKANGTTISSVQQFALSLSQSIPGAVSKTINALSGGTNQTLLLDTAMKVARGTTGDLGDVTEYMIQEYRNFNKVSDESIKNLAQTYELAQKTQLPFQDVKEAVKSTANTFKDLGDNTAGAIQVFNRLASTLRNTTGIDTIKSIFDGITTSIGNLSIAQKSFLSQQTGGAGGLRGAFQIDKLISEGKLDEVYKKMEQSLKRNFGGQIRTLDEGAKSDIAAADLVRQVQFLKSGPFGSLVKSDAQAYKLLEAFKNKSNPVEAASLGNRQNLADQAQKIGEAKIDTQTSIVRSAIIEIENAQIANQLSLGNFAKEVIAPKDTGSSIFRYEASKEATETALSKNYNKDYNIRASESRTKITENLTNVAKSATGNTSEILNNGIAVAVRGMETSVGNFTTATKGLVNDLEEVFKGIKIKLEIEESKDIKVKGIITSSNPSTTSATTGIK